MRGLKGKAYRILLGLFAAAILFAGGYYAGKSSVKPLESDTFYAVIEEIRDSELVVQGLEMNDINKRGRFQFRITEETEVSWRGIPITLSDLQKGDLISITYTGLIQEISPAVILDVTKVQALGDELEERDIR